MFAPATRRYFQEARGFGSLAEPRLRGEAGDRKLGHFFEVQVRVGEEGVQDLSFSCPRCLAAIACGSYLYQTLVGQPLERAAAVTSREVLEALGGLPSSRSFYAWMAVEALRRALEGYHAT